VAGSLALSRPASADMPPAAELKIGAAPIESQAQAFFADDQGFFKKNGLGTVSIVSMRNGAASAAAVAAGDLMFGCASIVSLAQAVQRNLPFEVIVPGSIYDSSAPNGFIVTAPDSIVKTAKDLNGKTVACFSLGGIDQLAFQTFLEKNGGDPGSLKFVEIPQATTVDAVLAGRVDAAALHDPEFTAAKDRLRVLGDGQAAISKRYAESAWFTTRDSLANNKDTARRFGDAILAAGAWAMANPEAAAAVMAKRTGFREARVRQHYATTRDLGLIQVLLDAAARYKMIAQLNVTDFSWNGK
jgi:ABC-type nitrate/sulfonate/bicarbonate transport system substrate-binding protein